MKHSGQTNCSFNRFHLHAMIGICCIGLNIPLGFSGEMKSREVKTDSKKKVLAQLIYSKDGKEWRLSLVQRATPPRKALSINELIEVLHKKKEKGEKITPTDVDSFRQNSGNLIFEIIRSPIRPTGKDKPGEVIGVVYGINTGMNQFPPKWQGNLLWSPGKDRARVVLCKRGGSILVLAVFDLSLSSKPLGTSPIITKKTVTSRRAWPRPLKMVSEKKITSLNGYWGLSRMSCIYLDGTILIYLEWTHMVKGMQKECSPLYMLYNIKKKAWSKVTLQKVPSRSPGKKNQK